MFVVLLKFTEQKARAGEFMEAHNQWIKAGLDEGVFAVVGSLSSGQGGSIVAYGMSAAELDARLAKDPFVEQGIVTPEVLQIEPKKWDERLAFMAS